MADIVFGAVEEVISSEFKPVLAGMGPDKTITVLNPLEGAFQVKFARPVAPRFNSSPGLQFARERGLPLEKSNPHEFEPQFITISAKSTKNLPGDIAQKVVQDLITYVIQTRNNDGSYNHKRGGENKKMVSDPHLRQLIESEIVMKIYDTTEFFNQPPPVSRQEATNNEIEELNKDDNPPPGTGISYTPEQAVSAGSGQQDTAQPKATKKPVGRPPKE